MNNPPPQEITWQPPADFIQVPSAVKGIVVFAPRPKAMVESGPVTFKCPQCGATTQYDVAAGGVGCEYCGYKVAIEAEHVGRRAEQFEFTLETLNQAEKGWGQERKLLHCDSCGGEIFIEAQSLTTTCPFCASNKVNVRTAPTDQLRPRFLIPFKIKANDLQNLAQAWLGKGWFHPDQLSKSAILSRFTGIYLPFWTFSSHINANWKAEVGYERQERYYDASSREWRSRTVIDWRWENGQVFLPIEDLLIVGSSHVSKIILNRIQPFNLDELVTYTPEFLAGWLAHAYDRTLPASWEEGKEIMRDKAKDACYADIPTHHVRNFSMTADFSEESWRYILLPVYLAAYKFEDKVFQVLVNGQIGSIAGQKPVAWWKIWLAIAALLAPGGLLILLGLPLLLAGGLGLIPLVIGAILLVIGGVISVNIYRKAVESEAA